METALRVVGTLLAVDLAAALALVGLVALVGRRGCRVPLSALLGVLAFFGFGSLLIYGSLWLILRLV